MNNKKKDHQVVSGKNILIPKEPFICHPLQWYHCLFALQLLKFWKMGPYKKMTRTGCGMYMTVTVVHIADHHMYDGYFRRLPILLHSSFTLRCTWSVDYATDIIWRTNEFNNFLILHTRLWPSQTQQSSFFYKLLLRRHLHSFIRSPEKWWFS